MPRQCISKRNKNIKEREKKTQSGNIFTKVRNIFQIIFLLWPMIGKNLTNKISNKSCKHISIIYLLLDNVYRHSIQSNVI